MIEKVYHITPVPKPRMTQRDKWEKRPAVVRYRAFCDKVRSQGIEVPECGAEITFVLPMPKSWSKKKRAAMDGKPHQQKPDLDNCCKALFDAVHSEDCGIYQLDGLAKYWGVEGLIKVVTK